MTINYRLALVVSEPGKEDEMYFDIGLFAVSGIIVCACPQAPALYLREGKLHLIPFGKPLETILRESGATESFIKHETGGDYDEF